MATEHEKWRKFLQPVAAAFATLLAAGAIYLQQAGSEKSDAWQAKTETRLEFLESRSAKRDVDMDNLRTMMGDVRSDVSFIRGLLEKRK